MRTLVLEHVGSNLSTLQENLAGVRVIQASARVDEQRRRFTNQITGSTPLIFER